MTVLQMTFLDANGKSIRLTVPNANSVLEAEDIQSTMNAIITQNIFAPAGVDLVSAHAARFVATTVTDVNLA